MLLLSGQGLVVLGAGGRGGAGGPDRGRLEEETKYYKKWQDKKRGKTAVF